MINPNHVAAFGCWLLLALLPGCSRDGANPDVRFAKATFLSMVNGTADEAAFDWDNFHADDDDVGATYRALPNDAEKAELRKSFLIGFSAGTPNLRANPDRVKNWRIDSQSPSKTLVAADLPSGMVMLLTVSKRDGTQKITSLLFKK